MTIKEKKKLKEIANRIDHKAPRPYTGRWWRSECAEGCVACEMVELIK